VSYETELAAWGRTADAEVDALHYEVSTLTNEVARLEAEIGQATVEKVIAEANLAECQATLADVRRQLAECQGPPPLDKRGLVAVRVFPSYRSATYGQHEAVLARLGALGVKRISHQMSPNIAGAADVIKFTQNAYNRYGIKSWLTMGEPRVTLTAADWDKMQAAVDGPLRGMVEMVSGWNEPNHYRSGAPLTADWAARAVAHNREMYRRFSSTIPKIGTPQLWSGDFTAHDAAVRQLAQEGLKGSFNTITWHLYPRGDVGEDLLVRFETLYRQYWGAQQIICTEGGYLDAANYTGGASNMSPTEKARLVPLWADTYVKRGYGCSYFELLDDPDPAEANREASLGLVECKGIDPSTWSDKPAFASLKNYLAVTS